MPSAKRPAGYHSVTPYLIVNGAEQALVFYQTAFGAKVTLRLDSPDNKIAHAEFQIGDSFLMIADEYPDMGAVGPDTLGGAAISLMVYVEDVDQFFQQAILAGATELRPVIDQFYGDRAGTLKDPFGHIWTIATHQQEFSKDELEARFMEHMKG